MTARNFFLASSPLLEEAEVAALRRGGQERCKPRGGDWERKNFFQKREGIPSKGDYISTRLVPDCNQKGEENIEIEVILFIL